MNFRRLVFFLALAVALFGADSARPAAQQAAAKAEITIKRTMHYLVQFPTGYNKDERKWPLLIFLHGSGERGSQLKKVELDGPPLLIAGGREFPFIVVSPQCPEGQPWYGVEVDALAEQLMHTYRVDTKRVYLTGLSAGGDGAWDAAIFNPERYAAIVPVSGGGYYPEDAARLKNVAVWAFHGANDPEAPLPAAQKYVAAAAAAGSDAKLTIYPGAGHAVWAETYANPEVYTWLLAHARP